MNSHSKTYKRAVNTTGGSCVKLPHLLTLSVCQVYCSGLSIVVACDCSQYFIVNPVMSAVMLLLYCIWCTFARASAASEIVVLSQ